VLQAGVWCHTDHFSHGGLSVNCSNRCLLKLTEANCHPRYSCSKLLLIDVVFIWFSDRMLFTLTTLKYFFSRKNDAHAVANDDRRRVEIELYASVIFVDPEVQVDET